MPKLKTKKAAKKRYKQLKNNEFMRKRAFNGHLLEKKSQKRKRNLGQSIKVTKADSKVIRKMLIC
jgi:large subunit ribosomal protein L35